MNTLHPSVLPDDFDEDVDEPNFNNPNTSPHPPSPYADLEKKYRKNRFNKSRNRSSAAAPGNGVQVAGTSANGSGGNRSQKRKSKKKSVQKSAQKSAQKPSRSSSKRRNAS